MMKKTDKRPIYGLLPVFRDIVRYSILILGLIHDLGLADP